MRRRSRFALSSAVILAAGAGANAATYYWTGDVDGRFTTGGAGPGANTNWSTSATVNSDPGAIPLAGDDLVLYCTGAGSLTVLNATGLTGNSLTFSGPNAVTFTGTDLGLGSGTGHTGGSVVLNPGAGQVTIGSRTSWGSLTPTITNNSGVELRTTGTFGSGSTGKLTLAAGTLTANGGTSNMTIGVQTGATYKIAAGSTVSAVNVVLEGGTLNLAIAPTIGSLQGNSGSVTGTGSLGLGIGGIANDSSFGGDITSSVTSVTYSGATGAGKVTLTSAQHFTGNVALANSGRNVTLQLDGGATNILPSTGGLKFGSGTISAATTAKLIVGGAQATNQTIASLANGTVGTNQANINFSIVGGNAAMSTLTVNQATDTTWSGTLGGSGTDENKLALTKSGAGKLTLAGLSNAVVTHTYGGDTTITGGTLVLGDNAGLTFSIKGSGVNNRVTGAGTFTVDGDFNFDLSAASMTAGDSWNIVDTGALTETFTSNFTVAGFTAEADGVTWTKDANGTTYRFSEVTGVLSVVPEPTALALLSAGLLGLTARRKRA